MHRDMSLGSTSPTDEEVGLLDILLVLLENARLLIAVPLVASVLALVGVQFWPPVYESVAQVEGRKAAVIDGVEVDLFTPAQISALATARSTRELAFAKLQANGHGTLANMYEHAVISSTTPRNVSAVGVSVQAGSPVAAQQMLQAVVSSILEQTRPRGAEQERLQQNLDAGSAALARARAVEVEMSKQLQRSSANIDAAGRAYAELLTGLSAFEEKVAITQAKLEGLGEAAVLDAPSLPTAPVKPRKVLVVLLAALGAALLALLYVFAKLCVQNASQQEPSAGKLQRIRRALWLKSS